MTLNGRDSNCFSNNIIILFHSVILSSRTTHFRSQSTNGVGSLSSRAPRIPQEIVNIVEAMSVCDSVCWERGNSVSMLIVGDGLGGRAGVGWACF